MIAALLAKQFPTLAPEAVADLERALDVRDFADDHVFIHEGRRDDTIFLLVEGTVDVTRARARATEPLNVLGAGELFGLVALVDESPRSATCRARGPCRVGSWPRSVVHLLFNQRAPIAHAFQLALAMQLARDFRQLDARVRARMSPQTA